MITQFALVSRILVFLINVTGISLIITVLIEDMKPVIKRIFILMNVFALIWVDLAFFARLYGHTEHSLLFIKIAWSITPMLFVLIYSFIVNFIGKAEKYKVLTVFSYAAGSAFLFVTLLSQLIVKDTLFEGGILKIEYGRLIWLYFAFVGTYTLINFYLLIKNYKSSSVGQAMKSRLKYLILGLSILFTANAIFNIIYPVFLGVFNLYEFGDYSTVVFMALVAYVIVRHKFFDVKVLGTSFFTSFLGSFLLVDAIIFSDNWIQRLTKGMIVLFYIPFGVFLVRGVIQEVRQREKLQELTKKLKETDKQKDEFISMAAHELRSPMTAIKGYVSMILEGDTGNISEKAKGYLTDAKSVTERSIRLVNNMLNVARIEEGRIAYQMEEVSLIKAVQDMYHSFGFEADRKGLSFKLSIPDGIRDVVHADPDKIREVFGNLISNAIKFTEAGKVEVKV